MSVKNKANFALGLKMDILKEYIPKAKPHTPFNNPLGKCLKLPLEWIKYTYINGKLNIINFLKFEVLTALKFYINCYINIGEKNS